MQLFAGIRTFRYSRKSLPSVREITRSNGSQSETNAASLPSGDMAPIPPRRSLTLTTSRREKTAARIDLFWTVTRSEEHTSELQSRLHLVCRLLLEKKKKN